MISGPVFPRTRAGLWGLIDRHLDEIECGLALVERDVELEPGWSVDGLAVDAAGRPVFLFTVDADCERELPARLLATRAWLATGAPLLARFVQREGIDFEQPPRLLVVGFELSSAVLHQLGDLQDDAGVEAYQLRTVRIGGCNRVGVLPLVGADRIGDEDSFRLPRGVSQPRARTWCVRFLDLMRRLEPDLQVTGDRYSRRFSYGGQELAELLVRAGGTVWVRVAAPDAVPDGHVPQAAAAAEIRSTADCAVMADRVMRRFLDVLRAAPPARTAVASAVTRVDPGGGEPEGPRLSLERLRKSVETAQLSPEEYLVLGDSSPDDDGDLQLS